MAKEEGVITSLWHNGDMSSTVLLQRLLFKYDEQGKR